MSPSERAVVRVEVMRVDGRYRITSVVPLVAEILRGGTVTWDFSLPEGATARVENFRLKVHDTPFVDPWTPDSRAATVRAGRSVGYKYDIVLGNGERLDPEIVIYDAP